MFPDNLQLSCLVLQFQRALCAIFKKPSVEFKEPSLEHPKSLVWNIQKALCAIYKEPSVEYPKSPLWTIQRALCGIFLSTVYNYSPLVTTCSLCSIVLSFQRALCGTSKEPSAEYSFQQYTTKALLFQRALNVVLSLYSKYT